MNDARVMQPFGRIAHLWKHEHHRWFLRTSRSSKELIFAIEVGPQNKHVGNIGLKQIDWRNQSAEVWIYIGDCESRGKGYGKVALTMLIRHAFSRLKLHRLQAWMLESNKKSMSLFRRCGFKLEGRLKDSRLFNGSYQTTCLMACVNSHDRIRKRPRLKKNAAPTAIFICDIYKKAGLGHFRRCSFFAEQLLQEVNMRCIFLLKRSRQFPFLKQLVQQATQHEVRVFDRRDDEFWRQLGNVKLIVIDSYNLTRTSLTIWRQRTSATIVVIDDYGLEFPEADFVVNPNVPSNNKASILTDYGTPRRFDGEGYFIANSRYKRLNKKMRPIRAAIERVLISIGGNPNLSMLREIIEAIRGVYGETARVHITGGPFTGQKHDGFRRLAAQYSNISVLEGDADVTTEFVWCDLALISGGVTKYEAAITGTPCILIVQHKGQIPFVKAFVEKTGMPQVGDGKHVPVPTLQTLLRHLQNRSRRQRMSKTLKQTVDGKGFDRVWPTVLEAINS